MNVSRIALALRRIACGRVPISGGGTANMSRHDMMQMARLACEEMGEHYAFTHAWAPDEASARLKRAKRRQRARVANVVSRGRARGAG